MKLLEMKKKLKPVTKYVDVIDTVTLELTPKQFATLTAAIGAASDADLQSISDIDADHVGIGMTSLDLWVNMRDTYNDIRDKGAFE